MKDRQGSRFRSQSSGAGFQRTKSKDRAGSQIRPKSELAKDVEEIKKDMKRIEKLLEELKRERVNTNFVEEEYEVNIRYVDKAKGMQMIVHSGDPKSITTNK